ncbi:DJ-1/PfpI family protein [Marinomonas sp. CT5]|uniref:DJ-1/PfpI family protein n=1 Tax=Marinomonas sp. CT5 TaxID=2066133 RepID=UPI0020162757|nr:DJ-1/PfpI family protein [Marinomonas sp. CT5]
MMKISILTFDGFNELDSFIALGILNRVKNKGWKVSIACPTKQIKSMNGVVIERQASFESLSTADAVIIGSGIKTREVAADASIMAQIQLDPSRQVIGAQCSGALVLAKLGLLDDVPACTDITTLPWVKEAGVEVLNQAFFAKGNIATAGGCLASHYLAAWVIAKLDSIKEAQDAIDYVAPVGEKEEYVCHVMQHISPYL